MRTGRYAALLVIASARLMGCDVYDESLLVRGERTEVTIDEATDTRADDGPSDDVRADDAPSDDGQTEAEPAASTTSTVTCATSGSTTSDDTSTSAENTPNDADDGVTPNDSDADDSDEGSDTDPTPDDSAMETSDDTALTPDDAPDDEASPDDTEPTSDDDQPPDPPTDDVAESTDEPADDEPPVEADAGVPSVPEADAGTDPPASSAVWSFDSDVTGWVVGVSDPTTLRSESSLSFDAAHGVTTGSLRLDAAFTRGGERLAIQSRIAPTDLRGRTLSAMVLLGSGLSQDSANPSAIKLFAKSGSTYVFASGAPVNLLPGADWVSVEFDIDQPDYTDPTATFDASDVREVGFELIAGATTSAIDGATVYFDEVDY